jgi:hypothetical protein
MPANVRFLDVASRKQTVAKPSNPDVDLCLNSLGADLPKVGKGSEADLSPRRRSSLAGEQLHAREGEEDAEGCVDPAARAAVG